MKTIISWLKRKHFIHSWVEDNWNAKRYCSVCGAKQFFLYDSNGGEWYFE